MKSNDTSILTIKINGLQYFFNIGHSGQDVKSSDTVAQTLRELLLLTGTKTPCDRGACGGCTVLLNGKPTLACSTLTVECDGAEIVTIEGLSDPKTGVLHPIQQAFIDLDAIQCGMCTPGITLTAKALLDKNPTPTRAEVCAALAGNICRCTGYEKYIEGVILAAKRMRNAKGD
jgi:aerobic-type carbon monoxide dehydrogenase small subunit (CoxS/CutS family)